MDYKQCLKVHGYIADNSDSETESSNVEEIYNKYKPPPVPYDEFKHRVITIYADSSRASHSNNRTSTSSKTFRKATATAKPSATVQRNRVTPHVPAVARPVSNAHSVLLQRQLDQFANSYQQRTDTPIRDILARPTTVRAPPAAAAAARVQTPPAPPRAARVFTVTPPPPAAAPNIPIRSSRTARGAAAHSVRSVQPPTPPPPAAPQPPSDDIQVPYQPLVESEPARRPRAQRQQQQEEETNNCCCCIC